MSRAFTADRGTSTVDLDRDQLITFADRPGTRVQVLFGGLWLTEERSLQDRFAAAGEWLRLEAPGLAVAEALGPTRVRVLAPARRPSAAWRERLLRWRPRAGALAMRSLAAAMALVLSVGLAELTVRSFMGKLDPESAGIATRLVAPRPAVLG